MKLNLFLALLLVLLQINSVASKCPEQIQLFKSYETLSFGSKIKPDWPSFVNKFESGGLYISVWAKFYNLRQHEQGFKHSLFTIQDTSNPTEPSVYEWALSLKDFKMHLLYNGQEISHRSVSTTISGNKLDETKWFLAIQKKDTFTLDTKIISANYNVTNTFELHSNAEDWKDNFLQIGTNGDIETWSGQLYGGLVSEDFDNFGFEEEKFHYNENYNAVDEILLIPNLAKDIEDENRYAKVLVKDPQTKNFLKPFVTGHDKKSFGVNEFGSLLNSQFSAKSYLMTNGVETSRQPEMGFQMSISGNVKLINRVHTWQVDNSYYKTRTSVFPIYRLLDDEGKTLIEIVNETRALHRIRVGWTNGWRIPRAIASRFKYKFGKNFKYGKWHWVKKGNVFDYQFNIIVRRNLFSNAVYAGIHDNFNILKKIDHIIDYGYFPSPKDLHLLGWEFAQVENRLPVMDYNYQDFGVRFGPVRNKHLNKKPVCDTNAIFELGYKGQDSLYCHKNSRLFFNGKFVKCKAINPDYLKDNCLTKNMKLHREGNDICLKESCFACIRNAFFDTNAGKCTRCSSDCDLCSKSASNCLSCKPNFQLVGNQCNVCDESQEVYDQYSKTCVKIDASQPLYKENDTESNLFTDSVRVPFWNKDETYMLISFILQDGYTESQDFSILSENYELKKFYFTSKHEFMNRKRIYLRVKVPPGKRIFFRINFHTIIRLKENTMDATRLKYKFLRLPKEVSKKEIEKEPIDMFSWQDKSVTDRLISDPYLNSETTVGKPSIVEDDGADTDEFDYSSEQYNKNKSMMKSCKEERVKKQILRAQFFKSGHIDPKCKTIQEYMEKNFVSNFSDKIPIETEKEVSNTDKTKYQHKNENNAGIDDNPSDVKEAIKKRIKDVTVQKNNVYQLNELEKQQKIEQVQSDAEMKIGMIVKDIAHKTQDMKSEFSDQIENQKKHVSSIDRKSKKDNVLNSNPNSAVKGEVTINEKESMKINTIKTAVDIIQQKLDNFNKRYQFADEANAGKNNHKEQSKFKRRKKFSGDSGQIQKTKNSNTRSKYSSLTNGISSQASSAYGTGSQASSTYGNSYQASSTNGISPQASSTQKSGSYGSSTIKQSSLNDQNGFETKKKNPKFQTPEEPNGGKSTNSSKESMFFKDVYKPLPAHKPTYKHNLTKAEKSGAGNLPNDVSSEGEKISKFQTPEEPDAGSSENNSKKNYNGADSSDSDEKETQGFSEDNHIQTEKIAQKNAENAQLEHQIKNLDNKADGEEKKYISTIDALDRIKFKGKPVLKSENEKARSYKKTKEHIEAKQALQQENLYNRKKETMAIKSQETKLKADVKEASDMKDIPQLQERQGVAASHVEQDIVQNEGKKTFVQQRLLIRNRRDRKKNADDKKRNLSKFLSILDSSIPNLTVKIGSEKNLGNITHSF